MREIAKPEVKAVMDSWVWDVATNTLYDLCRRHPTHRTIKEIIGKVLLIGRSNAAAIERRRNVRVLGDFYELKVGPEMLKAGIDSWFAVLKTNSAPGCPNSIEIHRKLQDLFLKISKLSKRSLASK